MDEIERIDPDLRGALVALRDEIEGPPAWFLERQLAILGPRLRWRAGIRRLVSDPRAQYAAASFGGAVLGAAAVALLWGRGARRAAA